MWIPSEPILAILQTELTAAYNAEPQHLVADTDGVATRRLDADVRAQDLDWQLRALGKFEVTGKWPLSDPGWLWMKVISAAGSILGNTTESADQRRKCRLQPDGLDGVKIRTRIRR